MKLLVVDDEKLIAKGVAHVIRQFESKFDHVDIAFSGEEALEKMAKTPYDLLITDVSMPGINGLQLIAQAKRKKLCGFFCILSGYSEFEYARTAIQLGVEDYLLKPVDKAKLSEMLAAFADKLHTQKAARRREREEVLADCLFSSSTNLKPNQAGPLLVVVAEQLFHEGRPLSRKIFEAYYEAGLTQEAIQLRHLPAFALFCCPRQLEPLLSQLVQDFPAMSVGTAQGETPDAAALRSLYHQALHAALVARCFLSSPFLSAEKFPRPNYPDGLKKALKDKLGITATPGQLLQYQACWQSLAASEPTNNLAINSYVDQLLGIIKKHFVQELTLGSAAKEIGLNPEYAGKLFRGETGMSFSEYLNRYRLELILECIVRDPSQSFEQLAPCMGFPDMRNFYRVFKRLTGTTPGKYRAGLRPERRKTELAEQRNQSNAF